MNNSKLFFGLTVLSVESFINYSISNEINDSLSIQSDNHSTQNNLTINGSDTFQLDKVLIKRFTENQRIDSPWYYILITMYSILILFGVLGNIMVVIAVLRKPVMRTARNLFILNLAISDLLLCLVTMPLTLKEILSKFWPFGQCEFLCKLIAMLQALSIFVSTISITAIAFDRYQVIVYPTKDSLQIFGAVGILVGIWLLAILLASPLFIYKRLILTDMPPLLQALGINDVSFCIEDWPTDNGRFYYSIFSLIFQYLLPIIMVSAAYFGIYNKLKNRITVVTTAQTSQRKAERGRRMKRTNCLLISIAIIFGISWLPLNIFNLYADMQQSTVTQEMFVAYAICHMIGMSSACSNPLLYGWLNDNFRKEFNELLCRNSENTNLALNGHTTGSAQTRRRRKQAAMGKKELKRLKGDKSKGCMEAGNTSGIGIGYSAIEGGTESVGGQLGAGDTFCNTNPLRSAITESVVLTENPLPSEISKLVPRSNIS